jgi:hypothetical protein
MTETSWEEHVRRRTGIGKWLLIVLPVVLVAAISIYNNRDVIYKVAGSSSDQDSGGAFFASDSEPPPVTVEPRVAESVPSPAARVKDVPRKPLKKNEPEKKVASEKTGINADSEVRRRNPDLPVAVTGQPERSSPTTVVSDSVEIGEIPCKVLNRDDIVMMIDLVVFCDWSARRNVLMRRDMIGVLVQNALHTRDLETVKPDALKPELLGEINRLFKAKIITGISFRSIRIEKVSSE